MWVHWRWIQVITNWCFKIICSSLLNKINILWFLHSYFSSVNKTCQPKGLWKSNCTSTYECKAKSGLECKDYGPSFGWSDIRIEDKSNTNRRSYSRLHSYRFKSSASDMGTEWVDSTILGGESFFQTLEIEVFQQGKQFNREFSRESFK